MKKLEVNYKLEKSLQLVQTNMSNEEILQNHYVAKYEYVGWLGSYKELNLLSLDEMAQALIAGYEVKETPEEKYNRFYEKYSKSSNQFETDFLSGMIFVAELFELDVDGRAK